MTDRASELVVELARLLLAALQQHVPDWQRAYLRFEALDDQYGSNGSYITDSGIFLFSVFQFSELFDQINSLGFELREVMSNRKPKFYVFLLTVESDFTYKIDFEYKDKNKWQITKLDGASGIPEGLS